MIPQYGTIQKLDQELRDIFVASPKSLRCGALPDTAYVVRPTGAPSLPSTPPNECPIEELKHKQRQHTLEMVFAQIFCASLSLEKRARTLLTLCVPHSLPPQACLRSRPHAVPGRAALVAVGRQRRSRLTRDERVHARHCPELGQPPPDREPQMVAHFLPRVRRKRGSSDWKSTLNDAHADARPLQVAQSSLVIKSPGSMLARHAWGQLNLAVEIFESASVGGAPVSMFVPRLRTLRDRSYTSLQASLSIPSSLGAPTLTGLVDPRDEGPGTDADLRDRKSVV